MKHSHPAQFPPNHYHPAWPYEPHMHPREQPFDKCPALACQRSKTCCSAYRGTFCLRLFKTTEEMRSDLADKLERLAKTYDAEDRRKLARKGAPRSVLRRMRGRQQGPNRGLADLKRCLMEREHEVFAQIDADWKAGKLDDTFGPYSPRGVYIPPPPLEYTEIIRDAQGEIIATLTEKDFTRRRREP